MVDSIYCCSSRRGCICGCSKCCALCLSASGASTIRANVVTQLKNAVLGETILIDSGHGAQDAGAVGNGLLEKNVNLEVALKLRDRLNQAGAITVMSRSSDTFDSLQTRVSKGAQAGADVFQHPCQCK